MLTREDLPALSLNTEVVKAVLAQAEKMHSDLIDDKKSLESKASTFFNSYITIATALLGIGGTLAKTDFLGLNPVPFFVSGFSFVAGCCFFVSVQQSDVYGISGSDPRNWLEPGWFGAKNDETPLFNAYLVMQYVSKIDASIKANKRKRLRLAMGMYFGIGSILLGAGLLAIFSLYPLGQHLLQSLH